MGITVTRKKHAKPQALPDVKVQAGWFAGVTKHEDGADVAQIAAWLEFGTSNGIPPRPVVRPAVAANRAKWQAFVRNTYKKAATGEVDVKAAMAKLGLDIQGAIQKSIAQIQSPPLADSTVKARGRRYKSKSKQGNVSNKPWVDTGLTQQAVSYKVEVK